MPYIATAGKVKISSYLIKKTLNRRIFMIKFSYAKTGLSWVGWAAILSKYGRKN